jgi:hypothetical protein
VAVVYANVCSPVERTSHLVGHNWGDFFTRRCACISSFFWVNQNDRVNTLPHVHIPVLQADIAEQLREHWAGVFIVQRERAMPFIAIRKETRERIDITTIANPRAVLKSGECLCQLCGAPMIVKAGLVRQHHFAHIGQCSSDYQSHPESPGIKMQNGTLPHT